MRVLHVAAEAAPYSQSGGLGQVAGTLPQAQADAATGVQVGIITPLYQETRRAAEDAGDSFVDTGFGCSMTMAGIWHSARILRAQKRSQYYFVDCPAFFGRHGMYGDESGRAWHDNAERFAMLARAAVDCGDDLLGGPLDVLHAHDWQAGLAPAYLLGRTGGPATVFTIHNLAFRGVFDKNKLGSLGLDWPLFTLDGLEFYDQISFLKAGAAFSDAITTVSPSYADEIQTPAYGHGLHEFFAANRARLTGILNGIDVEVWNPQHDPALAANFSADQLGGKTACRAALADLFGLDASADELLCGVVTRLTEQKGPELIAELVPMLSSLGARLVVLGSGEREIEHRFETLGAWFRHHVSVRIGFDEQLAHQIFAGSDVFLMPSRFEPCGLGQMIAMRYGALPIVHAVGGLADTVVDPGDWARAQGTAGTGYRFDKPDARGLEWAVGRAAVLHRTAPEIWRRDVREAMTSDWSWTRAAQHYLDLYRRIIA